MNWLWVTALLYFAAGAGSGSFGIVLLLLRDGQERFNRVLAVICFVVMFISVDRLLGLGS